MPHLGWHPVVIGDNQCSPAFSTSIVAIEAERLAKLAAGRRVLEIGTAYGYSAIVMALAGAEHVTTIDLHEALPTAEVMKANLVAYGVSGKVTWCRDASERELPMLRAEGFRCDLIFIDGDHLADSIRSDVTLSLPLLEPGGILAVHDYGEDCVPDVRAVCDELLGPPGELVVTLAVWREMVTA